jgi:hypothetical protein
MFTDGRLRKMAGLGSPGKAFQFDHFTKNIQPSDIHVRSPLSLKNHPDQNLTGRELLKYKDSRKIALKQHRKD